MGLLYEEAAKQKDNGRGHWAIIKNASINWFAWLQHKIVGPSIGIFSKPATCILWK